MLGAIIFIISLIIFGYLCKWLARRNDRKGFLGFLNRIRGILAYEGDFMAEEKNKEEGTKE